MLRLAARLREDFEDVRERLPELAAEALFLEYALRVPAYLPGDEDQPARPRGPPRTADPGLGLKGVRVAGDQGDDNILLIVEVA